MTKQWWEEIPSPEELRKYDEVIPDGAVRVLRFYEKELAHQVRLKKMVPRADGFVLVCVGMIGFAIGGLLTLWIGG